MNRSLLLFFFVAIFSIAGSAQDIDLCRQVISAAGKSANLANRNWSYTVGEPIITTLNGSARTVTQGFHQPELCSLVATNDLDLAEWQLAVFPNPTTDFLHIQYASDKAGGLEATVFDVVGRAVVTGIQLSASQGSQIDATGWKAGLYLLQLRDPRSGASATFRIIRL